MFATYLTLAQEARDVVKAHKEGLVDQIEHILSDGVKQGAFDIADVKASARAIFDATIRFHHPAHAEEWNDPALPARIDALLALLLKGLEAPKQALDRSFSALDHFAARRRRAHSGSPSILALVRLPSCRP